MTTLCSSGHRTLSCVEGSGFEASAFSASWNSWRGTIIHLIYRKQRERVLPKSPSSQPEVWRHYTFFFFIYLLFLSNSCNPLSPTVFIAFLHSFKLKSMFSQSCAVPCYRLNEAINVRRNRNWSWFLSFLVNGQRKRAQKKTENRKPANLKAASTERIPADSCLWWEKIQPLGTSCATAYSQVTHPIESRSNIIPCFCTQSSVTSVACSLYCCVFVNSCRFFLGGGPWYVGGTKCQERGEKNPKGGESSWSAKCAIPRLVQTSKWGAKTNIYPVQNIILGDIIPNNCKCASSHSKTVRTARIVLV